MKKICVFMALVLALLSAAACAENAAVGLIADAGKLAFETGNVTLTAKAEFQLDGQTFKVFDGEYKQDDYNSYLRVMLDTPRDDGSVYTGGYEVVGNYNTAYAKDTYFGNYFTELPLVPENTILKKTALTSAAMELLKSAVAVLEDGTLVKESGNGEFTVQLEEAPALINSLLTYYMNSVINERYYYYQYLNADCGIWFDDFEALIAVAYENLLGEKMPESFIDDAYYADVDEQSWLLYEQLYNDVYDRAFTLANGCDGGLLRFLQDGTSVWYPTRAAYLKDIGQAIVDYDDYTETFRAFYQKKYQKPLTEEMEVILSCTGNMELWQAQLALMDEMEDSYNKLAEGKDGIVYVNVHTDGTCELSEKLPEAYESSHLTVTQQLIKNTRAVEIGACEITIAKDENGNLASGKGSAAFRLYGKDNTEKELFIRFEVNAFDYGTTFVRDFAPSDYNSQMYDEFIASDPYGAEEPYEEYDEEAYRKQIARLPKTIEFGGKIYETMIYTDIN